MDTFVADVRYAFRLLRKSAGFSAAALVVLALGIGANTAVFSIVYGVLLRPLPFAEPDRLVQLWHVPPQKSFPGMTRFSLSAANYLDWKQQNHVFESSAIYSYTTLRLTGGSEPHVVRGARVEPTFFRLLGVNPLLGRAVEPGDDRPDRSKVVVLSNALWKSQFGGDPAIVGRQVELDREAYTVLGVMPATFAKPQWAMMWVPLVWTPAERAVRGEHHYSAVARLKPGISVAQAQADLDTISARLAREYPTDNAGWGANVSPLREETVGDVRTPLLVLLGAVGFVLLIACANVANLMLAKTFDRQKEVAIRTALGAARGRIIRQVLSESVLISIGGAALGLVVARFATALIVHVFGSNLPRVAEISIDAGVLAFTCALAVATGIVAGAVPAVRLSNASPGEALKQGGRTDAAAIGHVAHDALIVVEVAASLLLLVGAGLMIRTLWNLRSTNPGFDPDHVMTMSIGVSQTDYRSVGQEVAFLTEAIRRIRSAAGVESAALIDDLPLEGGSTQPIAIEGRPELKMSDQPEVSVRIASPGYFSTMRIPLIRGRDFSDRDNATAPKVVVISASMARQFWPNEDPIGRRLKLTFFPDDVREVVGIVGDVKDKGLNTTDPEPMLYWPIAQVYTPKALGEFRAFPVEVVVRSAGEVSVAAAVQRAIHEISPGTPLVDVRPLDDIVAESIAQQRFNMLLLAAFAGVALLLAAVGIYSVLAYGVRRRVREIGIRMALGAGVGDIVRAVVGQGLRPTLVGVGLGLAGSLALGRLLRSLVYGVGVTDLATLMSVSVLLLAVAFLASLVPAYRATRVDPLEAVRAE